MRRSEPPQAEDLEGLLQTTREKLLRARELTGSLHGTDWLLVVMKVDEADQLLTRALEIDPDVDFPLLGEVLQEIREATSNFQDSYFLRDSRAARRNNPRLFVP